MYPLPLYQNKTKHICRVLCVWRAGWSSGVAAAQLVKVRCSVESDLSGGINTI